MRLAQIYVQHISFHLVESLVPADKVSPYLIFTNFTLSFKSDTTLKENKWSSEKYSTCSCPRFGCKRNSKSRDSSFDRTSSDLKSLCSEQPSGKQRAASGFYYKLSTPTLSGLCPGGTPELRRRKQGSSWDSDDRARVPLLKTI